MRVFSRTRSPHKYWRDGNPAGTEVISLFLSLHPVLHNSSPPIINIVLISSLSLTPPASQSIERSEISSSARIKALILLSHTSSVWLMTEGSQTLLPCEGGHSASGWSHTLCTEHLKLAYIRTHNIPMYVCD